MVCHRDLWRQFLHLSVGDLSMAVTDPLTTFAVAHLPDAATNLQAVGVLMPLVEFLGAPLFMLLHGANALAPSPPARRALLRFVALATLVLAVAFFALSRETSFAWLAARVLGVDPAVGASARAGLALLVISPVVMGFRRYFQGLLVAFGHSRAIFHAALARMVTVVIALGVGVRLHVPGASLAAITYLSALTVEAVWIMWAALHAGVMAAPARPTPVRVESLKDAAAFYAPLAGTILVMCGARALLVPIVARASDGPIALAVWAAAFGVVRLVTSAARVVQQVVIKHQADVPAARLFAFVASAGALCTGVVALALVVPGVDRAVAAFIGGAASLAPMVQGTIAICVAVPALVAVQNGLQGFLIARGRARRVNDAVVFGSFVLLATAALVMRAGAPGASAAAIGTLAGLLAEVGFLASSYRARAGAVPALAPSIE
jgi:hypothetical protein